jgi:hypothetical protein
MEHAKYIYTRIYCIYERLLHQQYDRLMPSHCVNYTESVERLD